ncbi:MAG TPA: hypothetical protein VLS96_13085 [Nodosilinea sp.]|nr:hypothetical protein [Nodosilinea sp.]
MSSPVYPTRAFIRFTAKSQLTADLAGHAVPVYVDRGSGNDDASEFQPATDGVGAYCDVFQATGDCLDEALFQRITADLFDPDQHPELYRPCTSATEAAAVETQVANAIVAAYKQASLGQRQALVEQFNALLER